MGGAILVNTCAVTAEAVRQAKQAIRRARRENPDARIVVSGCAVQVDPAQFAGMDEVDLVLGNEEKLRAANYGLAPGDTTVRVNDIMSVRETAGHLIEGMDGRTRAFVEVQNGCDHRCTFCIIPYGRGPSRSVPMGVVVDQIRHLVENGYREVVLTGVDITAYGARPSRDVPTSAGLSARSSSNVPELERLRLSSIDSIEADEVLLCALAEEERLMPHLHLSLQSGDDMILKRMKRRHSRADALRFVETVRRLRPDIVFGADIIAGFPTETEAMFGNSLSIVDDCGLTHVHVFPFSPRPGTPAARMPQLDRGGDQGARRPAPRERRAAAFAAHLAVRARAPCAAFWSSATASAAPSISRSAEIAEGRPGDIVAARITGATARRLIASPLAEAA